MVCTPGWNLTNPLEVETFSSETGKWSRYVVNIDSKIDGVEWIHRSAYLDGRLYRLLKTDHLVCIDQGLKCLPKSSCANLDQHVSTTPTFIC
ncbi:hypothetical protein LIER_02328 [Lithospermum erythrorhizon]|uniref:Uncharacterized protein n=1 Tax=Lithospermum erythrorhizon TaxID=34254 RepID=A0AAV3NPG7_LITER